VRSPAQYASRAAWDTPAIISATLKMAGCGYTIQIASASAVTPSAIEKGSGGIDYQPSNKPALNSQLNSFLSYVNW
jgi:hypothetical protein